MIGFFLSLGLWNFHFIPKLRDIFLHKINDSNLLRDISIQMVMVGPKNSFELFLNYANDQLLD